MNEAVQLFLEKYATELDLSIVPGMKVYSTSSIECFWSSLNKTFPNKESLEGVDRVSVGIFYFNSDNFQ